jgi:hypothetical protein
MPDVVQITIQLAPQIIRDRVSVDPGQVAIGYYVVDGDVLTMTDASGAAMTDAAGNLFTAKVGPGDDYRRIAGYLMRNLRARLGLNKSSFNRPLRAPDLGVV